MMCPIQQVDSPQLADCVILNQLCNMQFLPAPTISPGLHKIMAPFGAGKVKN